MRIGVDVGGTNTDAVLMEGDRVVVAVKHPTTPDVTAGVVAALGEVLATTRADMGVDHPVPVDAVVIGTTHFTNAVIQAHGLTPTACVRLAAPATTALAPGVDWPRRLRKDVLASSHIVPGGFECDGRPIASLDVDGLRRLARQLANAGVGAVAVSAVHSHIDPSHELAAREILGEHIPGADVSLSHEFGRTGLLERENATILNASLRELARRTIDAFESAVRELGVEAPVFLSQNDGTVLSAATAAELPVATFASGPVNSMRGAALLSGLHDCMIVDIGGTTADVGALHQGFPREASMAVDIGGVRTNFRMPDVLSVGVGGGSVVRQDGDIVTVGPDSVGYRLTQDGLVFGGDTLTASDVAVAAGRTRLGRPAAVAPLARSLVEGAVREIDRAVGEAIDRMRTSPHPVPTVIVGGGSVLVGDDLPGVTDIVRPPHFGCANAVGAAIARVGADVERVVSMTDGSRDDIIAQCSDEAIQRCVSAGAFAPSVKIADVEEVGIAYVGGTVRLRVRAVGDLEVAQP